MRKVLLLIALLMGFACCKNQAQSTEGAVKDNPDTKKEIISYKRQVYDELKLQNYFHNTQMELYSDIRKEWVKIKSYEEFCDATADSGNFYTILYDLVDYGYKIKNFAQFKEMWQSYDSLVGENEYKIELIKSTIYMDIDKVIHKSLDCPYFGYHKNKHAYKKIKFTNNRNLNFNEMYYCNYCLSANNILYIKAGR